MASTRVYFYNEAIARTTSTTTNYSTVKVSLAVTPNVSKTYAIFWSVLIDGTSPSLLPKARLQNTTSATTLNECDDPLGDSTAATSRRCVGGVAIHTDAGSGTAQTFEIQVASSTASITIGASEACILALELIPSVDVWGSSSGVSTNATSSYVAKLTLGPWTPASAGSYLVLFSATGSSVSNTPLVRVNTTGGVISSFFNMLALVSWDSWAQYIGGTILTSVSGAQTAALEYLPWAASGESEIRQAYGVALRLDEFINAFTDLDMTVFTTTSATYANAASVIGDAEAADYLVLAFAANHSADPSFAYDNAISSKTNAGGADVEATFAHLRPEGSGAGGGTDNKSAWLSVRKRTETAGSTTWKTMYARTAGTLTVGSYNNVIAALQLQSSGPPPDTMRLSPDTVAASTNITGTGTIANIQDDPDSPDGSWFTATSATAATDLRVTFPSPSGDPISTQNFRMWLRKTTGTATPTVDVSLYQGGTLRALLTDNSAITSTTGEIVQSNWAASQLVTVLDGSDVECRIVSTAGLALVTGALPALDATAGTVNTSATMAGTFDVNVPAHTAGDCLILHVLARNTNNDGLLASINTAGWTQAGGAGGVYGGTQNARVGFGWKIGNGSETVVNITITGGATSDLRRCRVYHFTAANGYANPPVSNISTATTGTGTALGMPTVATTNGGNQLAVALLASSVTATLAAATGETGGDWTELIAESTGTNGLIGIQTSNQSASTSISGGTATLGTSGNWVAVGFRLNPADYGGGAAQNTVEIGAVEWNVAYTANAVVDNPAIKRYGGVPFMTTNLGVW